MTRQDRYRGALLGLAAGDALGTTLEFKRPGTFAPITDMVGGGPFGLEAGEWTDDTSMALCLAESLVECRRFDPVDQLQRYVRWWHEGHHSSTGRCFDIGYTVRGALVQFQRTGEQWSGSTDPKTAGNGSLDAPRARAALLRQRSRRGRSHEPRTARARRTARPKRSTPAATSPG